ncbi:hypothetical protein DLNHIDIE_02496 [Acidithiobacillus thiooxidans ATCC 19377]|jgi:hypothetical protein|uniref:Uncharacterized protein n=2 Tax=Acidithiobacillus TaxID=119977 RepID=A0A543Q055_ACITH|nr:hypothetical protein DLNHIDIE_02496 [Acidithiobacillus thiooxidans ATCC 19377]
MLRVKGGYHGLSRYGKHAEGVISEWAEVAKSQE